MWYSSISVHYVMKKIGAIHVFLFFLSSLVLFVLSLYLWTSFYYILQLLWCLLYHPYDYGLDSWSHAPKKIFSHKLSSQVFWQEIAFKIPAQQLHRIKYTGVEMAQVLPSQGFFFTFFFLVTIGCALLTTYIYTL